MLGTNLGRDPQQMFDLIHVSAYMNFVRISVCCLKDLLRVLLNLCKRAVDRADDGFGAS
jgi:hypothetical protein